MTGSGLKASGIWAGVKTSSETSGSAASTATRRIAASNRFPCRSVYGSTSPALRRRFAFIPLAPNYETLRLYHSKNGVNVDGLVSVLKEVNKLIGDPHYEIGISFFLRPSLSTELESIWRMEIEPYLEEFFFDRHQKLVELRWEAIQDRLAT
jgi:hypothetical protein